MSKAQQGKPPIPAFESALELIRQLGASSGIHLDVGAGLAAVAEQVQALGLVYVALAHEGSTLASLQQRGIEAHALDLSNGHDLPAAIERIRSNRALASVSLVGALEQVSDDAGLLASLRYAVEGRAVPLVLECDNIASTARALDLVSGRWSGSLARHTTTSLDELTRAAGWREVSRNDRASEPDGERRHSIAHSSRTQLNQFVRKIRQGSDESAGLTRFIRAYLPAQSRASAAPPGSKRPFLSVVMRTQGRREGTLRDALLSLAAQSDEDFELILLPHKVTAAQFALIEQIVAEHAESLREKIRIVRVDQGGRAAPLNVGFAHARGEYVSVLDDDDVVFGHWVESFHKGASEGAGTLLRAIAVEQDIEARPWNHGTPGYRTLSGFRKTFPPNYDLYAHLTQNFSPLHSLAFPSAFFLELGQRFDEELNTCEDWDYEMRCALTCGVTAIQEYTAVYRMWKSGASSYTDHSREDWKESERRIVARLDAQPHVFPAGTIEVIRKQQAWIRKLEKDVAELRGALQGDSPAPLPPVPPPGSERPVRYDVADELNRVFKRLPAVHPLLKASLRKLKR